MPCCCYEIKQIYEDKTRHFESMAEHWKEKTALLVSKYYKSLSLLRQDYDTLK